MHANVGEWVGRSTCMPGLVCRNIGAAGRATVTRLSRCACPVDKQLMFPNIDGRPSERLMRIGRWSDTSRVVCRERRYGSSMFFLIIGRRTSF